MFIIRHLGLQPYHAVWDDMKAFTLSRQAETPDELWLLEHDAIFTQGQAGKAEHILNSGTIPVLKTDRGGQVTYHGPGQLVAYLLMDLRRKRLGIKTLVSQLEQLIIAVLAQYEMGATVRCGAPGVYIDEKKIASIGLRVKNGCTYHGIALNVAMDLTPFNRINPCGFNKLEMTQLRNYIPEINMAEVNARFAKTFLTCFAD